MSAGPEQAASPDAPVPSGGPVVSVVVTARNAAHQLPTLFEALSRQTLPRSDFEVIVVDDASSDSTSAVVEASDIARVIRCDEGIGPARARNVGIRAATGELIAITDADTVPDPTWLEMGARRMAETRADIIGGDVSIPLGDRPSIAALVDAMNWLDARRCVDAGFALSANLWARRATFDRWGFFSEEADFGHEDAEWGKRAIKGGARLVYAPDVRLTHPSRERMAQVWKKAYRHGVALAPHRRPPLSTVAGLPPLFLRPTPFMPPRRIPLERLRSRGYDPRPIQAALVYLSQWLCVRLPMLVGDVVGELAYSRKRRRG